MNNIKRLTFAMVVIVLSGCSSLQQLSNQIAKPQAKFHSLAVGKVSATSVQLLPVITITNNSMLPIPINNISYQLSLNNKQLVNGMADSIGTLPANGSKNVTLALDVTKKSLSALQQLLFKNGQVDYQVSGKVNLVGFDVPFEREATLYMPKVSISNINVGKASFDEVALSVDLALENKNDFNLPLDNLSYQVSSNSTALFSGALQQQEVKPGSHQLTLPIKIKPNLLFSNIFSLLSKPNVPLTIDIKSPLFSVQQQKNINLGKLFK